MTRVRTVRNTTLVCHDLGDAKQNDGCEEKQVDIGLDLAVATKLAHFSDHLLARAGGAAGSLENGEKLARLDFQPLDPIEEVERAQTGARAHGGVGQHHHRKDCTALILLDVVEAEIY